jgi:hypothetical protein
MRAPASWSKKSLGLPLILLRRSCFVAVDRRLGVAALFSENDKRDGAADFFFHASF